MFFQQVMYTLQEFFYSALRPYVHYLPLARNLSDIHDIIQWARANPIIVQAILNEARFFRRRYLNGQTINNYLLDLLTRYSNLQKFTPKLRPGFLPYKLRKQALFDELIELSGGSCPTGNISIN